MTYFIYGTHAVEAALKNKRRGKKKLYVTEMKPEYKNLPFPVEKVDYKQITSRMPGGAVHQGVALEVENIVQPKLDEFVKKLDLDKRNLVVILDQLTNPQNIGAILRTVAAFRGKAVIAPESNSPAETGAMAKSAAGALEFVPFIRVPNLARAMELLKKSGFWTVGLDGKAKDSLYKLDLPKNVALVMGSEGEGLRPLTQKNCDFMAKLDIDQSMESLNVSIAAGIAVYEIQKMEFKADVGSIRVPL